ncbi:MAG TPA: outer membrane beta-barrel protein [Burkholderiales bacterium]|nr:outer membrane beta-barrel protein [Burkholderiales bacterium]
MTTEARKGMERLLLAGMIGGAMAASSPAALAQAPGDMGWYVGAAIGQTEVNLDCTGTTACDDKDSSWKIFAGYQFNRNFAVEFGYTDLGEATASTPPIGIIPPASVAIESTVWELVAVGILPLADRFSAYGKLGLYRADTDVAVNFVGLGSVTDSDSNTDLTFGIGVRFDITPHLGVRLEWQRYSGVAAADFDEGDVDAMSLGVAWRF